MKEIQDWRRITEGDLKRLWEYSKNKIKDRTILTQEKLWNEMKTGKVLRMHKTKWFKDEGVNNIKYPKVYILKRMRIGNSTLKSHCGSGLSKRCKNCVKDENETNEHYLLKCPKFNEERKEMMENIRNSTNMNENLSVSTFTGFSSFFIIPFFFCPILAIF